MPTKPWEGAAFFCVGSKVSTCTSRAQHVAAQQVPCTPEAMFGLGAHTVSSMLPAWVLIRGPRAGPMSQQECALQISRAYQQTQGQHYRMQRNWESSAGWYPCT